MLAQLRIEKFTNHVRLIFAYSLPMGGERSSTTRMRLAGKICCSCKSSLSPPHSPGEKYCARCQSQIGCRRVYMYFMLRDGWHCQFLEADLKTPLPKKAKSQQSAKGYRDCRAWWLQHEPRRAAGIGPWDREWTRRHLAASDRGAIPKAQGSALIIVLCAAATRGEAISRRLPKLFTSAMSMAWRLSSLPITTPRRNPCSRSSSGIRRGARAFCR